jgi:hypothetical protein
LLLPGERQEVGFQVLFTAGIYAPTISSGKGRLPNPEEQSIVYAIFC